GGVAGIRWYEIGNASAPMDHSGDLAIGFSAASSTVVPALRYAGRLATDAPNTLGQGEATLFAGGEPDRYLEPLGRLQRPDHRPGGRLHLLVHERVLPV